MRSVYRTASPFLAPRLKVRKDRYSATALAVSKDSLKVSAQQLMKKHKIPGMSMLLMKSLDTIQTLTFGVTTKRKRKIDRSRDGIFGGLRQ